MQYKPTYARPTKEKLAQTKKRNGIVNSLPTPIVLWQFSQLHDLKVSCGNSAQRPKHIPCQLSSYTSQYAILLGVARWELWRKERTTHVHHNSPAGLLTDADRLHDCNRSKVSWCFNKQIHRVSWVSMVMDIQLTFTSWLRYLKSMMDSHNLSLEKHAKPVCSSVDFHSLMYNWCFYREGIAQERYRVQTTLLCRIIAYDSQGRALSSNRVVIAVQTSRYSRRTSNLG